MVRALIGANSVSGSSFPPPPTLTTPTTAQSIATAPTTTMSLPPFGAFRPLCRSVPSYPICNLFTRQVRPIWLDMSLVDLLYLAVIHRLPQCPCELQLQPGRVGCGCQPPMRHSPGHGRCGRWSERRWRERARKHCKRHCMWSEHSLCYLPHCQVFKAKGCCR